MYINASTHARLKPGVALKERSQRELKEGLKYRKNRGVQRRH